MMLKFKLQIICFIMLFVGLSAFAQKVTKVDGTTIEISLDGSEVLVNKKYFLMSEEGKRKGIIQIISTDEIDTAQGKMIKGDVQVGWILRSPESLKTGKSSVKSELNKEPMAQNKKQNRHFSHGLLGAMFFGNVTSTGSVSDGVGGSVSYNAKLDMSGLGLGYEYNFWIDDLSLGADFRYESYSLKSDSGSASGTLYKIGVTGGYLLSDLGLKLNFGYCLFGTSGSSGISSLSGLKFGGQYYFTDNIAGIAELHMISSTSASAGEGSTQASTMTLNTYNFGVGYYF
jgi:hypothetical protein